MEKCNVVDYGETDSGRTQLGVGSGHLSSGCAADCVEFPESVRVVDEKTGASISRGSGYDRGSGALHYNLGSDSDNDKGSQPGNPRTLGGQNLPSLPCTDGRAQGFSRWKVLRMHPVFNVPRNIMR